MMNPDGSMGNIIVAFAGIAISMAAGFLLTMIFYHEEEPEDAEKSSGKTEKPASAEEDVLRVASPLKGTVIPLSQVDVYKRQHKTSVRPHSAPPLPLPEKSGTRKRKTGNTLLPALPEAGYPPDNGRSRLPPPAPDKRNPPAVSGNPFFPPLSEDGSHREELHPPVPFLFRLSASRLPTGWPP